MSVVAIIRIVAKPGQADALVTAMGEPVRLTQENPECSLAELYRSTARPDELVLNRGMDFDRRAPGSF